MFHRFVSYRQTPPATLTKTVQRPRRLLATRQDTSPFPLETQLRPNLFEGQWNWQGMKIRYHRSGDTGPSVILVHGFGGNCEHWRKNTCTLGTDCRVYSLDLLGFGFSEKPDPRTQPPGSIYNFDQWAKQVADFTREVVESPSILVCNSIGGIVGLQAALSYPESIRAVQLLNISLRELHIRNQSPLARPFIKAFQDLLYSTPLGILFFKQIAKAKTVEKILKTAYHDPETVTNELIDVILKPGLEPNAALVFLAFISYSGGPLPGELLQEVTQPVSIIWGSEDPWESIHKGRKFASLPSVEEFIELPGVGHCPQDEASEMVNPLIKQFVTRHST
eukprot:g7870.t1